MLKTGQSLLPVLFGCLLASACGSATLSHSESSTGDSTAGAGSSTAGGSSSGTATAGTSGTASGSTGGTTSGTGTTSGSSSGSTGSHHSSGASGGSSTGHHTSGTTGGGTIGGTASSGGESTGASTGTDTGGSSSGTTTGGNTLTDGGSPIGIGSRIPWGGSSTYLLGVNVPWYNWGSDFGGGSGSGVSSTGSNAALAASFSQLQDAGIHMVRWWLLEGEPPTQILVDDAGNPSSIDTSVYADIDSAIDLARTYDLYYDFVLFDGPEAVDATWQSDDTKRAALVSALGTLFAHYASEPRILSWEVYNEPEWDIWYGGLDAGPIQETVKEVAASVHQNSMAYVTVGSARVDGLGLWTGLGLDYYSAHWYDNQTADGICALCTTYGALQTLYSLDAPVTLGEFEALPDAGALGRFDYFYDAGYAGAWPWSLFPGMTSDGFAIDLVAEASFASEHNDIGPQTAAGGSDGG